MRWVEVIALRSLANTDRRFVQELLDQILGQKGRGCPASIRVYRRSIVETDLSIHFHWDEETKLPCESALGQRLCSALKGLGLINHSIWVEMEALEWPAAPLPGRGVAFKSKVPGNPKREGRRMKE
jgi:hypothetical protein